MNLAELMIYGVLLATALFFVVFEVVLFWRNLKKQSDGEA
jgi:hypothetical protein